MTDWLARNVLSRKGWFTPPFDTRESLFEKLDTMYHDIELDNEGPIVFFSAVK